MLEYIKNQCNISIDEYENKVCKGQVSWVSRGILMSEGFSVCSMSDLYNIDVLIESGIKNGKSTNIWVNYMPQKKIISIDKLLMSRTLNELFNYKNLEIIKGNSIDVLPKVVKENPNKRIGIFIDGPKGLKAINLAKKCYKEDNVFFIAIHDLNKANVDNRKFAELAIKEVGGKGFFTDNKWFVDNYKYLDKNESKKHDTGITWYPYRRIDKDRKISDFGGSYGWTIGFFLKERKF